MSAVKSEGLLFGRQLKEEREYWVERLTRECTPSGLPADHPRPARRPLRSATVAVAIPDDLFSRLGKLTGNGPFLLYTTLCAALQICLARYAGSSTIAVGSPARKVEGAAATSNALAIVGEVREEEPFSQLLQATRQTLLDAYARQRYPLHRLLDDLGYGAQERQCPLFGVVLALRDIHEELPEVGHDVHITFTLGPDPGAGLAGEIAFDAALFETSTVERFARHYLNVLRSALADPRAPIRGLELLDDADRALFAGWSRGSSLEVPEGLVHQLIEAQAERAPDAPAVLSGDVRLSYRELDMQANRLAHHLRRLGVAAESRVAIAMESSPQAMVAILAALKAGAAYVPLDPKHPKDRLAAILADVRPAALITLSDLVPKLPEHEARLVLVDRDREAIALQNASRPAAEMGGTGLIYVIYTSGSTGVPNGVMISHRALVIRAQGMRQLFDLDGGTRQLQFASLTFDMSCEEILATWIFGGAVVLLTAEQRRSELAILAECDRLGVTKINMASSVWHNLVDAALAAGRGVPASLQVSVAGAESPSIEKLQVWNRLARHPLRFFNIYGPTEATIMATFFEVALGAGDLGSLSHLPIGLPLPDTLLHVLDSHLRPVPIGVPGELHIGGIALARGYFDRPHLTARKFIPDPWSEAAGARLYKTGDLARYNACGLLEFLGRVDFQVKIRGFRVELGEIEAILCKHPAVRRAVVLAREDVPGDKRLAAYVVASEKAALDVEELRRHLLESLPEHMVPGAFLELDEIPLLPSGKIDRQALPAPDRAGHDRSFVAPRTPVEARLAEIWTEILNVEPIGAMDDFFRLGGHSLLVMQLVSRIEETFEVEMPLQRVFEVPTLAELAAQIARATGPEAPPLVPVSRGERLPLSFAQQRLWFIDQLEPGNPFYNVPSAVRLTGRLDVAALETSLNAIVRRHEVLRTTFSAENGRPLQHVHPELVLELPARDLRDAPDDRREALARELIDQAVRRPFDLARGPLLQAGLIRLAEDDHVFLVTAHHIVCDAWSVGVFNRELAALYRAAVEGREPALPELPVQYADFAHWQRRCLEGDLLAQQVAYWKERLSGASFDLDLPVDRPRPAVPTFQGAFLPLTLSRETSEALERLSRKRGVTLFMSLLAALTALLSRYTGQRDLVVGSPSASRGRAQTENLIGCFLNTILLRVAVAGDPGFLALLGHVRDVALGAFSHQDLPFEKLVEELDVARDLSRQPLFQVMFVVQGAAIEPLDLPELRLAPLAVETGTAKFDLTVSLAEAGGRLSGGLEYSRELFDAATIGRLTGHLVRLLEGIAADPGRRVSELPLLTAAELQQVEREWNDTRVELPPQTSIHALFEAQAARTPEATAVASADGTLSYAELNVRANRLAHALGRLGVGPEDRVGICMERSAAMLVASLAALKAGGVYVPLDPGYPRERLDFLVDDAGISAFVLAPDAPRLLESIPCVVVDDQGRFAGDAALPETNPPTTAGLQSLAYVMYTSGSTGVPKGVEVPHAGVLRLLWQADYATLDGRQTLLQAAPMSFDASTLEVWGALLLGGRCVPAPREIPTAESLRGLIERYGVDTLWLTSSLFNAVVDEDAAALGGLRQLLIGGEALSLPHVRRFRSRHPHVALINGYGPTESTTFTCCHAIPQEAGTEASIPIGKPIVNTRVYVLDDNGQLAGAGMTGELCVGGLGLARGYLRRPSATAERFVPDPFSPEEGARLYRTGDLVRWRHPGALEFLGRRDQQVKVRGHRIELGEVETLLGSHESIAEAVVLVREVRPGHKVLVAYVTAAGDAAPATEDRLGFLRSKLPDPMVPRVFVPLPAMPRTASGKIDRRALQALELTLDSEPVHTPPATPVEEIVASIWENVMGRERIGRDDDFFALGGHSLLATQVVARVRQAFSIELPVRALFESPKLSSFALHIERAGAPAETGIELQRIPRDGDLPLSLAQRRLWFVHQVDPGSPVYTIPAAVRLTGRLDAAALARSLDEIRCRHEALRTSFPAVGGEPVQRIAEEAGFPLEWVDLGPLPEEQRDAAAMRRAGDAVRQPFDLGVGPLIRGLLLRLREEEHVLVLTMSHIVADGWSIGVLARELGALYDAFSRGLPSPLPELPIQYADFAHWQRRRLSEEVVEEQLRYWREHLRGALERLELPGDRPRPAVPSFAGASERFVWPPELSAALHRLGNDQDATPFMTLLAAFQVLLYRQSSQTDLCIGTPIANRTLVESEALIGFFVNTLVLRARLENRPTFRELLRQVREVALSAYAHQDVPFEMVVEALRPQRSTGYAPLFQVMFNFGNAPGGELRLPGLTLSLIDTELGTSKFDLGLTVSDTGERLQGGFTYSSDLFDATTIRRLAEQLETLLGNLTADPGAPVSDVEILSDAVRHQILVGWNDTRVPVRPPWRCVHELFAAQAARRLEAPAVIDGERELTYGELDRWSNRLARALRRAGARAEALVALCMERSVDQVAGALAALKAGCAFVVLDPAQPERRRRQVLSDAAPVVVLTHAAAAEAVPPDWGGAVIRLEEAGGTDPEDEEDLGLPALPEQLAYVVYTSGSTGTPKGILISHQAVVNLSMALEATVYRGTGPDLRVSLNAPLYFDASIKQLIQLLRGRTLCIVPEVVRPEPRALSAFLAEQRVDVLDCTPAQLQRLVELGWGGEGRRVPGKVLVGGEAVSPSLWDPLRAIEPTEFFNVYGPSECTVDTSVQKVAAWAPQPGIGSPLANVQVYVMDRWGRSQPPGAPGELCVGGAGLARGYLGRPELTAERFVPHPYGGEPGARLYRSGDLARWRANGTIEFLGRIDQQIKLHGFRIEPGEIESVLREHPWVGEAVVVIREDAQGDRRLVAYVVAGSGGPDLPASELRELLRERLSQYMVPGAIVQLAELPLTSRGKVDRRALPAPEQAVREGQDLVAPRDAFEMQVAQIWRDVLGVQAIGVHDSFFDLGGHSLLMVTMMERIRAAFGRVPSLSALLQQPTVAELASLLRQEGGSLEGALVRMQPRGTRKPFFCVHPAGGAVLSYLELARQMAPEQPFYALQANGGRAGSGVEELAGHYLAEVLAAQPEGPYSLGGHSFGGVVAYEMARQLEEQGRTVALLALFDAAPASPGERSLRRAQGGLSMASFARHLGLPVDAELLSSPELAGMTADEQLSEVLRRAQQARLVSSDLRHHEARRLFALFKEHAEARLRYVPPPYRGRVVLFRAQEQLLAAAELAGRPDLAEEVQPLVRHLADPAMGWGGLAAGGVEVHELPGDHDSMLRPPHVSVLAGRLKTYLEQGWP